jgi:hypothetical protein
MIFLIIRYKLTPLSILYFFFSLAKDVLVVQKCPVAQKIVNYSKGSISPTKNFGDIGKFGDIGTFGDLGTKMFKNEKKPVVVQHDVMTRHTKIR